MPRPKGSRDADYAEKRTALLRKMMMRLMRRETARPSMRELAEAAEVSVPTLRHYFGGRAVVVTAILEEFLSLGRARVAAAAETPKPFAESVHDFARSLVRGLRHAGPIRLGDAFAVGLAEGLLDRDIGPAALRFIIDPAVDALRRRLDIHIARGEMIATDSRPAALMLLSPILVAALHQDQMGGQATSPIDMDTAMVAICDAFIRAYARTPVQGGPPEPP